jgi:AcrR family transcriptional regulator
MALDTPGLRARKAAKTKAALLDAMVARLGSRSFEDVSVKELCEHVSISEPTFFAHFPRKTDLLFYFLQTWTLRVAASARAAPGPRAAIWAIFETTAKEMSAQPRVAAEVMAFQARMPGTPSLAELTLAERQLALPGEPDVEALPAGGLQTLLPQLVRAAVSAGELPKTTDQARAVLSLATVFFGVPVTLLSHSPHALLLAYRAQLDMVWSALSEPPATKKKARKS